MSARMDPLAALRRGVKDLNRQAGGLVSVRVVMMKQLPVLIGNALAGDAEAITLINGVRDTLRSWEAATAANAPLCVTCPRPLRPKGYNLAFAAPKCDDPTRMLALGVCHHCASDRAGVMDRATEGLRQIWPELRSVYPTHATGGRA